MSSSISDSDRLAGAESQEHLAWRRWLIVFCGVFFGIAALLYTLLLLIDPYDTTRFPNFGIVGIDDINPRTAHASRGHDPRFNAAVIGSSTGQLVNPFILSKATGLSFNQLTIPGTGPREQLAVMRWVLSRHASYAAFVIVTDISWCSPNPSLPLAYPFPFWLYGGDLEYLANVLSSKSLDRAAWRIRVALGLRPRTDPVGYSDYTKGKHVVFVPGPPGAPEELEDIGSSSRFPWIDQLNTLIGKLPKDTAVVLAMPPVYFTMLSPPGSKTEAAIEACKLALAKAVLGRPHSGFLDFRVDNAATRDVANFVDRLHYRNSLARPMEQQIIAILRSGEQAPVRPAMVPLRP